ncbi:hypothetical protein [Streptomyces sp. NPDC053560]|uniref:hypothetical protein n=1 Tax=Streptomyces sp. NPDC053560 TaxID=3365711 RepID=UPI0037CD6944
MALRGSATRRSLGSPMVSLLRDIDRRTRTTTRRARPAAQPKPPSGGDTEAETPPPAPAPPTPAAAVLETGNDGRARWHFPTPFTRPPAITALPVDPHPEDDTSTVVATLETVSDTYAELRVWRTRPLPHGGAVEPAGPGVCLHVTATSTTA